MAAGGNLQAALAADKLPECWKQIDYNNRPVVINLQRSSTDKKGERIASNVQWPLEAFRLDYISPEINELNPRYIFALVRGRTLSGDYSFARFNFYVDHAARVLLPKPTGCSFYIDGVQATQYVDGRHVSQPVQMSGVEDPLADQLKCSFVVSSGNEAAFTAYGNATEIKVRLHDAYEKDFLNVTFHPRWPEELDQKVGGVITKLVEASERKECAPKVSDNMQQGIGASCFLTTAVCDVVGLTDDCWELSELRRFRDSWLVKQSGGRCDIEQYYRAAPAICARLAQSMNGRRKLIELYWVRIVPCAIAARLGLNNLTRCWYTDMMVELGVGNGSDVAS